MVKRQLYFNRLRDSSIIFYCLHRMSYDWLCCLYLVISLDHLLKSVALSAVAMYLLSQGSLKFFQR